MLNIVLSRDVQIDFDIDVSIFRAMITVDHRHQGGYFLHDRHINTSVLPKLSFKFSIKFQKLLKNIMEKLSNITANIST